MLAMASDFDGTLYFMRQSPSISEKDIHAIRTFQSLGHLFGICTGRSLVGIDQVVEGAIHFDFYILASGAVILDGDHQLIYKKCMPKSLAKEVHDLYIQDCEIVIQANDTVYTFGKPYPLQTKISSMEDIPGDDIYGLSIGADSPLEAERIAREINEKYPTLMAFQNVSNIDLVMKGCSKGHAIEILKDHFRLQKLGGIGDSFNDLPMLEKVDIPFTFSYAPAKLQDQAKYIVASVSEALTLMTEE